MLKFIVKKLLGGVLVIWGITTLLFVIFNLLGDPTEAMVGQRSDMGTQEAIRKAYHLDRHWTVQYLYFLNDLSPVSLVDEKRAEKDDIGYLPLVSLSDSTSLSLKAPYLRKSFQTDRKVGSMLLERLPGTAILAVSAMLFATIMGIFLGLLSALKRNSWGDRLITFITLLGISAPSFFVAVVLIRIFAVALGDVTHLNITGYMFEEEVFGSGTVIHWRNLFLPALALGIRPLSIITQLTRASMIEVMSSDFIRTAKAKGLSTRKVIVKHGLRNALNPVVTSISSWFASLLAGAFFIETIFDWQGIGKLTIDALDTKDYPVILGAALFIGVIFVIINLLVDILYTQLDPRVKLKG